MWAGLDITAFYWITICLTIAWQVVIRKTLLLLCFGADIIFFRV
ncbi:MAG: hypothetical protein JWQ57_2679 [Mucilaginibacter sp.]|nr:hypothetical protein [Mucilaginibacter sp.]